MSLRTTLTLGTALGGAAAVAIYAAAAPAPTPASATQKVSVQAVPTPTKTVLAPCDASATLENGVCVTHIPGPVIVAAPRVASSGPTQSTTSAPTASATSSPATYGEHDGHENDGGGHHDD